MNTDPPLCEACKKDPDPRGGSACFNCREIARKAQEQPQSEAPRRMTDDELKEFVRGVVGGKIFTNFHISVEGAGSLLGMVFMPIGLGGLQGVDVHQIGCVWEHYEKAGPRGVNGYPSFLSMQLMHKDDWTRARPAIEKLERALKEIEL